MSETVRKLVLPATILVGLVLVTGVAHVAADHFYPGSGWEIKLSDGLVKGIPVGVEFRFCWK